jgi:S-adenosylmethionine hydrolase
MTSLVFLFTDFGATGPYTGQLEAAVLREAPDLRVVSLQSDAPSGRPRPAGYLLAALLPALPPGGGLVAVVDPGVGTARDALAARLDDRWLVGPDNGLLAPAIRQANRTEVWRIAWRPAQLSSSFHGRDLFAPVCARLVAGNSVPRDRVEPGQLVGADWPEELAEVVYIDHFGNAMTGIRAGGVGADAHFSCGGRRLRFARVFGAVAEGEAFWYANSCGLVEVAVNRGSAAGLLGLHIGSPVQRVR